MNKYGSYLVCKEHVQEVKNFLSKFFSEKKGKYNHDEWISFTIPGTDFLINLMEGEDQPITQNMVFEIYCNSMKDLESFAKKHGCKINNFLATATGNTYTYHYAEVTGPAGICKIEASYCEDQK